MTHVYVARQPIFDKKEKVLGYELLFRSGLQNFYDGVSGDKATQSVINSAFGVIGIHELVGDRRAFINFTDRLLKEGLPLLLPRESVTVEILENVELDAALIQACRNLKTKGYQLALDDFVLDSAFRNLVVLADIIKVDFLSTPLDRCRSMVNEIREMSREPKIMLAEKVENREVYRKALDMGYSLFQGYFFAKPEIKSGRDIPAQKLTYLTMLNELYTTEPDFNKIEEIIKRDVALTYKLLKLVNSASFGLIQKVTSIKHALVMMGLDEVRKWVSLLAISSMGDGKPDELVRSSIIRARFGELLAKKFGLASRAQEIFLMEIFSLIDAVLDRPMEQIIKDLPLTTDVRNVLTGKDSSLAPIYELIANYEQGRWEKYAVTETCLGIDRTGQCELLPEIYGEALKWSDDLMKTTLSGH